MLVDVGSGSMMGHVGVVVVGAESQLSPKVDVLPLQLLNPPLLVEAVPESTNAYMDALL